MFRLGLLIALATIALDQATKWLVLTYLAPLGEAIAITPFFNLVMVWNRGVSFGMFGSSGAFAPWILSGLAIAVVVALVIWLRRAAHYLTGVGLGLVIGGALGNVIDRVQYGAVIDFLDFHLAGWHWPAFNVADSGICVGAAFLVADSLFAPRRQYT
jgi:signal peptidase II